MKRKLSSLYHNVYFRAGLALLISAVTLILAVRNVKFQDIWTAISATDSRFVLLALVCVAVSNLAKTFRWRVLLGEPGQGVSLWILFQAIFVGQALNAVFPARIGDLSRVYIIGDRGPGRMFTLGTILIEKVLDSLVYVLLILLMLLILPIPGWISGWANKSVVVLIGATLGAVIIMFVIANYPAWFTKIYGKLMEFIAKLFPSINLAKLMTWFQSMLSSLEILKSTRALLYLTITLVISWGMALLNIQVVLLALGIHLPLTASLLTLIVLQAGISIPSIPGRIGVFEYICVLTLAVFGISQSLAFTFGVLLHGIVFIPPMLLGWLFIIMLGLPNRRVMLAEAPQENR